MLELDLDRRSESPCHERVGQPREERRVGGERRIARGEPGGRWGAVDPSRADLQHQGGRVVLAAALEGGVDQSHGGVFGRALPRQLADDAFVAELPVHAIGAEK